MSDTTAKVKKRKSEVETVADCCSRTDSAGRRDVTFPFQFSGELLRAFRQRPGTDCRYLSLLSRVSEILRVECVGAVSRRIHQEVFGPEAPITPGIEPSKHPPGTLPRGEACEVPVQWSCRTGVCHTCECALIRGTVGYEPDPPEPPATGDVLIRCSRASGEVEVDL
jgi:hypothetical protein